MSTKSCRVKRDDSYDSSLERLAGRPIVQNVNIKWTNGGRCRRARLCLTRVVQWRHEKLRVTIRRIKGQIEFLHKPLIHKNTDKSKPHPFFNKLYRLSSEHYRFIFYIENSNLQVESFWDFTSEWVISAYIR